MQPTLKDGATARQPQAPARVGYRHLELPNARWPGAHTFTCLTFPISSESDLERIAKALLKGMRAYGP